MATSGIYTFTLTTNDGLSEAFDIIGQGVDGESLGGSAFTRGLRSANLMLKSWESKGFHLWTETEGTLFLNIDQESYDFRSSTTHAANTFTQHETTADTAVNALSFTIASTDEISVDDVIGVIQSDDNLFWSTVSKTTKLAGSSTTITLKDRIPLETTSGSIVYSYKPAADGSTVNVVPIFRVTDVRRRETDDYEIPIIFESRKDYFNLPNKGQSGNPIQAYYDRQDIAGEVGGIMFLWNAPASAKPVINFTYQRKMQILSEREQTIDIPGYWQEAFVNNLALRLMNKYGGITPIKAAAIKTEADRSLAEAQSQDQTLYPITLDMSEY